MGQGRQGQELTRKRLNPGEPDRRDSASSLHKKQTVSTPVTQDAENQVQARVFQDMQGYVLVITNPKW